jgi:hypothetical protein
VPVVPLDIKDAQAFSNLPDGVYAGQIDKVEYREPREEGKHPQLMVAYVVIDGDQTGDKQSEFLSLSPKAAFRLKRWFDKFGLGELEELDVDDETNLLMEPDLTGITVTFRVFKDGKIPGTNDDRVRTELVSVEDDLLPEAAEAEDEPDDEPEDEPEEAPKPRRAAAAPKRPAPRRPAPKTAPARRAIR